MATLKMTTPEAKHLIELMIEARIEWPATAKYAAQDRSTNKVCFYKKKPEIKTNDDTWSPNGCILLSAITLLSLCRDWRQTIVTREQYAEAVADAESWNAWSGGRNPVDYHCGVEVKLRNGSTFSGIAGEFGWLHDGDARDILSYRLIYSCANIELKSNQVCENEGIQAVDAVEWHNQPSVEQLTADYHAKAAEADRLQAVADEALKVADDALLMLKKAGELIGLIISIDAKLEKAENPEITDWRDLKIGDVIQCVAYGDSRDGEPGRLHSYPGGWAQSVVGSKHTVGGVNSENGRITLSDVRDSGYAFRFICRPHKSQQE